MKNISIAVLALAFLPSLYSMEQRLKATVCDEEPPVMVFENGKIFFYKPKEETPLCSAVVNGRVGKVQELFKQATLADRKWCFKKSIDLCQFSILLLLIGAGADNTHEITHTLYDEITRKPVNMVAIHCLFNACTEENKCRALNCAVEKGNEVLVRHFLSFHSFSKQQIAEAFSTAYFFNATMVPFFLRDEDIDSFSKIQAIRRLAEKNNADSIALVLASGIELTPKELRAENILWSFMHRMRCEMLTEAIAHAKSHNNSTIVQALEPHLARETEAKNKLLDAKGR